MILRMHVRSYYAYFPFDFCNDGNDLTPATMLVSLCFFEGVQFMEITHQITTFTGVGSCNKLGPIYTCVLVLAINLVQEWIKSRLVFYNTLIS